MTEAMWIAVISGVFGAVGALLAKNGYDKAKSNGKGTNNNGSIERVISARADVEFQTRMTLLMQQLTNAIEKGHDKALEQMTVVGEAITDAAGAIREVHSQIKSHHEFVKPAVEATFATQALVREVRNEQQRKVGSGR